MKILIYSANFLFIIATLLPMTPIKHWTVRDLDFPRLQIFIFGIFTIVLDLYFFKTLTLSLLLIPVIALCCWQLHWILPYTVLWPKQVAIAQNTGKQLSILTANVLQTNQDFSKLTKLIEIHQPDLIVTLESDRCWQEALELLEKDWPYTVKCPLDNLYGIHLYSKLALTDSQLEFLVEDDIPSIHTQVHLNHDISIEMHFMHPAPPSPTENKTSKERDIELISLAEAIKDKTNPIIVTGDLNDVAWSPTTRLFRKISGLLDPRIGRGMFNTFHAQYRFFRWPLDHLFHSHHFKLIQMKRLPEIGSDHFPLLTRLSYEAAPEKSHTKIPDTQDIRAADDKIYR